MHKNMLEQTFVQQHAFMKLLQRERNFPAFPVDLTSKEGQTLCKQIAHDSMDELHEALQHLKNSKSHRATEIKDFDKSKFLEELSDHLHFFIELCIVANITFEELFSAYIQKGTINELRIKTGY